MRRWNLVVVVLAGVALSVAGCTSKQQSQPALAGPSELALSFSIQANPDVLRQDGASQSRVTILARDGSAQPVRNLSLRVDVAVGGVIVDYGQISAKNLVTGSDGSTSVVYTAPNASPNPSSQGGVIEILVTPVGTNYANALTRAVSIRLVPPGVILPPGTAPVPAFVFSPSAPLVQTDVTFDASSTTSSSPIVSYAWNFGDGTTGSGAVVKHRYQQASDYSVILTVTDEMGLSASTTPQKLTVGSSSVPTAAFVFSPSSPTTFQEIFFNASASSAAVGRQIVSYDWDFGTGRTGSGMVVTKVGGYDAVGEYVVTLVVTDDIGQKGTASKTVNVGSGIPEPVITFTPTTAAHPATITFNSAGTKLYSGSTAVAYQWDFGDLTSGALNTDTRPNPAHVFNLGAVYTVRVTITDSLGRVGTATVTVTIS
jgi:PKD repeat protein